MKEIPSSLIAQNKGCPTVGHQLNKLTYDKLAESNVTKTHPPPTIQSSDGSVHPTFVPLTHVCDVKWVFPSCHLILMNSS